MAAPCSVINGRMSTSAELCADRLPPAAVIAARFVVRDAFGHLTSTPSAFSVVRMAFRRSREGISRNPRPRRAISSTHSSVTVFAGPLAFHFAAASSRLSPHTHGATKHPSFSQLTIRFVGLPPCHRSMLGAQPQKGHGNRLSSFSLVMVRCFRQRHPMRYVGNWAIHPLGRFILSHPSGVRHPFIFEDCSNTRHITGRVDT